MSIAACVQAEMEAGSFPDLLPIPTVIPPAGAAAGCAASAPLVSFVKGEAEEGGAAKQALLASPAASEAAKSQIDEARQLLRERHSNVSVPVASWTYEELYELLGDDVAHLRASGRISADNPLLLRLDRLGYFVRQYQNALDMVEAVCRLSARVHAREIEWFHLSDAFEFAVDVCGNDIRALLRAYVGLSTQRQLVAIAPHPAFTTTEGVPTQPRGRPRKRCAEPTSSSRAARKRQVARPQPPPSPPTRRPPPIYRPLTAPSTLVSRCARPHA